MIEIVDFKSSKKNSPPESEVIEVLKTLKDKFPAKIKYDIYIDLRKPEVYFILNIPIYKVSGEKDLHLFYSSIKQCFFLFSIDEDFIKNTIKVPDYISDILNEMVYSDENIILNRKIYDWFAGRKNV